MTHCKAEFLQNNWPFISQIIYKGETSMGLRGDPVLNYLRYLFFTYHELTGLRLTIPANFASYPTEDQRVWLNNFRVIISSGHPETLPLWPIIDEFLIGGPRPPITG